MSAIATVDKRQQKKYLALVDVLVAAQAPYYRGEPCMPDKKYDKLYRTLLEMEAKNPELIVPHSPTQRVGSAVVDDFKSVKHETPMLSLDNVYSPEELRKQLQEIVDKLGNQEWVIEPKIDGASMEVRYENSELVLAATRGTGDKGDDVTENAKTVQNLPMRTRRPVADSFAVRGEVVITNRDFELVNKDRVASGKEAMANPRNAAAAAIKILDSKETARRRLSFLAYFLIPGNQEQDEDMDSHLGKLGVLETLGFSVPPYIAAHSVEDVLKAVEEMDLLRKHKLPYWTDGTVVKLSSRKAQKHLGEGTKSPKWAFACKFKTDQVKTKLNRVTLQVGKTGTIAPVAELEPVLLNGTTISRATLHNFDEVRRKDIRIGDTVIIQKAGEIIPEVVGPVLELRPINAKEIREPAVCPCCGAVLSREKKEDGTVSSYLYCVDYYGCEAQILGRLVQWCSKKGLDIEGGGPALIEKLFRLLDIRSPDHLYTLTPQKMIDAGIGEKTAQNFCEALEKSKQCSLEQVLHGLCIPSVGEGTSDRLANHFLNMDNIRGAKLEALLKVEDIGPTTAGDILNWMVNPTSRTILAGLYNANVNMGKQEIPRESNKLEGKTFVVTGTLEMGERDFAHGLIAKHGGKTASGVSKKVTHLLVGSDPGGSKLDKANTLGVPVITESQFFDLLKS